MSYETRLQRLEAKAPSNGRRRFLIQFVCPQRGITSMLLLTCGAGREQFERRDDESEEDFCERVRVSRPTDLNSERGTDGV